MVIGCDLISAAHLFVQVGQVVIEVRFQPTYLFVQLLARDFVIDEQVFQRIYPRLEAFHKSANIRAVSSPCWIID